MRCGCCWYCSCCWRCIWRCGCYWCCWCISCFWVKSFDNIAFCWKFDLRFMLASYLLLLMYIAYVLRQWLHWRKQELVSFRQNDARPLGKSKSCLCTNGQSVREGRKRTGRLLGVFSVSENGWKWALSNLTKKCFYLPLAYASEIQIIWPHQVNSLALSSSLLNSRILLLETWFRWTTSPQATLLWRFTSSWSAAPSLKLKP